MNSRNFPTFQPANLPTCQPPREDDASDIPRNKAYPFHGALLWQVPHPEVEAFCWLRYQGPFQNGSSRLGRESKLETVSATTSKS